MGWQLAGVAISVSLMAPWRGSGRGIAMSEGRIRNGKVK